MNITKPIATPAPPPRRRSAAKNILFRDAAVLYLEYSKAATSAETFVKRARFFA